jgi:predicted transcriptional regulator
VTLKRGNDLFVISSVSVEQYVKLDPVWVEHIKKAEEDMAAGHVTAIKSSDIWKKVREMNTP